MEKERVVEILLILILIVLIFIMVFIGLNGIFSQTIVTNSYNTYNTHTGQVKTAQIVKNPQPNYERDKIIILRDSGNYFEKDWPNKRHFENYESWGRHLKKEFSDYYTDEFEVHVINNGFSGKYYKVVFYFEDRFGNEKSYEMRKYIFSDEEEKFYFRDISKNKNEYNGWGYYIIEERE
jgi:hypothetical protein